MAWQRKENVGKDAVCHRQQLCLVKWEFFYCEHWSTMKMVGFMLHHQKTFPKMSAHFKWQKPIAISSDGVKLNFWFSLKKDWKWIRKFTRKWFSATFRSCYVFAQDGAPTHSQFDPELVKETFLWIFWQGNLAAVKP